MSEVTSTDESSTAFLGSSPAQLRHSLRTPLNHIIGYSEMIIEDLEDRGAAESAPAVRERLDSLVFNARELVKFIQNSLPSDKPETSRSNLRDLQFWLKGHVVQLLDDTDQLFAIVPEGSRDDVSKIRFAAERLLGFTEGNEAALADTVLQEPTIADLRAGPDEGTILVVDDSVGNRDILKRHLERHGYHIVLASNGRTCIELLESQPFDLVLLDVVMPELDGFEVLRRMKASPAMNAIPVIIISAMDESRSVIRCIQMGAEDYLMKPFDPVLLTARIDASLEKKRLRDQERKRTVELEQALTELHRTQDQLAVQEKLASLGALTAGIAHEIKNPLNFITNFAALSEELLTEMSGRLRDNAADPEVPALMSDLQMNVKKIEEHGKRADRIIRGMLMHSRSGSGQMETADLNAMLTDSVNLAYHGLRAQDSAFNVQIETDLDPSLEPIRVIPQDVSRVFINIISNAFYAAYHRKADGAFQPQVTLKTRNLEAMVEVRVRDNGGGIPPEVMAKIFNPFFTTKPAGTGTGLGLSISYDIIVRGHHGELSAQSEPGVYTEFLIVLPKTEQAG